VLRRSILKKFRRREPRLISIAASGRSTSEINKTFRLSGGALRNARAFGGGAAAEFFEFFSQLARDAKLSILHDVDAGLSAW